MTCTDSSVLFKAVSVTYLTYAMFNLSLSSARNHDWMGQPLVRLEKRFSSTYEARMSFCIWCKSVSGKYFRYLFTSLTTGRGRSNTDRKTMKRWAGSSHRLATCTSFITYGVSSYPQSSIVSADFRDRTEEATVACSLHNRGFSTKAVGQLKQLEV